MRYIPLLAPLLAFTACKQDSSSPEKEEPKPPKLVSYSLEARPYLIENCLSCHADLPLHDPTGWDLLHNHQNEEIAPSELLEKWVQQGSKIDQHWAARPLQQVTGDSIDDFLSDQAPLTTFREAPKVMFSSPVADLIAGDLISEKSNAISTGYFRQGEDSPEWRIEKVAQEFLGVRISCAKCHDHPSENWSHDRYHKLAGLFTTPYDDIPGALPPLYVRKAEGDAEKIAKLEESLAASATPPPVPDQDYLQWIALDEGTPSLPGLIASYSFDDKQLLNLAPTDDIEEVSKDLIAEEGAHGMGLLFNGKNELALTNLPIGTELDRFTISTWIKVSPEALADTPIATIGTREKGFEFRILDGRLQARWTRIWPQQAIAVTSKTPLVIPHRWSHLAVTYDGSRQANGLKIFINGYSVETEAAQTNLSKSVLSLGAPLTFSGDGLSLDELQVYRDALTPIGIRQLFDGRSLVDAYQKGDDLRDFYQLHFSKNEPSRRAKVRSLQEQIIEIQNSWDLFMVMEHSPENSDPALGTRLDFAKSLNQDLLARSLANEVWRQHFEVPLVHSLGFSDPLPIHRDLLEWLALELKKSDFDLAQLGEIIRNSKAWSQEWTGPQTTPATCPRPTE